MARRRTAPVLTGPQLVELQRLARARQHTYGPCRARVQNALQAKGLARFCEEDGSTPDPSLGVFDYCEITDAGRRALARLDRRKGAGHE